MSVLKIVTIGGGTGQFQILRGLKNKECDITAVVNMADDGGSSGRLRDEYGILPPGDARQCLVALSDEEKARVLRELFNYRLNGAVNHNLGNLIITALTKISGNMAQGIKEAAKLLGVKGNVLPVTLDDFVLFGESTTGRTLKGQTQVSYPNESVVIRDIRADKPAYLYKEAGEAIRAADKIVICPGDLYGSILPNFIIQGMHEALAESKAQKIYVCNIVTKKGTYRFKTSDFVNKIEHYSRTSLDAIIINSIKPSEKVIKGYTEEFSKLVEEDMQQDPRVFRGDFLSEYPSEPKTILRHNPEKIARQIMDV